MFESFKIVCYVPLIIFALGWAIAQILFQKEKRCLFSNNQLIEVRTIVLKKNSDLLLMGMLQVIFILLGIYFGIYVRYFLIGLEMVLLLIHIVQIGAAVDFVNNEWKTEKHAGIKLLLMPLVVRISCLILSNFWIIYVFWIAGLGPSI